MKKQGQIMLKIFFITFTFNEKCLFMSQFNLWKNAGSPLSVTAAGEVYIPFPTKSLVDKIFHL